MPEDKEKIVKEKNVAFVQEDLAEGAAPVLRMGALMPQTVRRIKSFNYIAAEYMPIQQDDDTFIKLKFKEDDEEE